MPSLAPDDARDRDADSDDGPVVALRQVGDEGREVGDDIIDRELDPGPVDADPLEHLATEADDGNRDRIHEDLEAQDGGAVRVQAHERGWPSRRAEGDGAPLDHQAGSGQLPDERADGAAREAGGGDELGTGEGTTLMKVADDGAEVRSMNGFAALSDVHAADSQGL